MKAIRINNDNDCRILIIFEKGFLHNIRMLPNKNLEKRIVGEWYSRKY